MNILSVSCSRFVKIRLSERKFYQKSDGFVRNSV